MHSCVLLMSKPRQVGPRSSFVHGSFILRSLPMPGSKSATPVFRRRSSRGITQPLGLGDVQRVARDKRTVVVVDGDAAGKAGDGSGRVTELCGASHWNVRWQTAQTASLPAAAKARRRSSWQDWARPWRKSWSSRKAAARSLGDASDLKVEQGSPNLDFHRRQAEVGPRDTMISDCPRIVLL